MKLFSKLLLAILAFLLLLGGVWLSLPKLLAEIVESQLSQAGLSDVEVDVGEITLQSLTVKRLKMSNSDLEIAIHDLRISYDYHRLLAKQLTSIEARSVDVIRLATNAAATSLPDPAYISGFLLTPWQEYNPASYLSVETLSLYDRGGNLSFTASIEISRKGKKTQAEANLVDSLGKSHSLLLDLSDDSVDMQWLSAENESEAPISLQISPNDDGSGLTGEVSIHLAAIKGLVTELDDISGEIQAKFRYSQKAGGTKKELSIRANSVDTVITGSGLNSDLNSGVKSIQVNLDATLSETRDGILLQFSPTSTLEAKALYLGEYRAEQLSVVFPRSLEFIAGTPLLNANNSAKITLNRAVLDTVKISTLEIKDIAFTTNIGSEPLAACRYVMVLNVPVLVVDDVTIEAAPYTVKGFCPGEDRLFWSISAESESVSIQSADINASFSECKLSAKSATTVLEKISGDTDCQNKTSGGTIDTHFSIDTVHSSGKVDYSFGKIKPDNEKPLINSLIKTWQQPFDIISGSVSAKGQYRWWKNKKGKNKEALVLDLSIEDAGGYYEGVLFSGLNYKDRLDILPNLKSSGFVPLTVTDIDIGIPITSVTTELSLNDSRNGQLPLLMLKTLSMSLLDGKIMGSGLKIDMNSDNNDIVLVIEGLDLAQIVEMQKLEGLDATGRLDGYMPITITNNGIKISSGKIVAQKQGGYVHYRPAGGTVEIEKSAIGSEFVFRIIEDLDYNSLTIDVDYREDGEMDMTFSIKGLSQKVDKLRPVHFNLNLQQNILQLLKGLRYAEGLSEGIDKNVQEYFKK